MPDDYKVYCVKKFYKLYYTAVLYGDYNTN